MKYYKILNDNTFIGVINSYNFIRYQSLTNSFICANEKNGQFVEYNGVLYRSTWMAPLNNEITNEYEVVNIIEISEEVYNTFKEAIDTETEIDEEDYSDARIDVLPVDPAEEMSIEFLQNTKINEMSNICKQTIEQGFDLQLRDEICHFSLTIQDQLNLMSLSAMAQTQSLIPYHADGEECVFYTAEEINEIISAATEFKNYQLTYYNALKSYIKALNTVEDISAITYGTPIPDEYKSDVLKVLE